MGCWRLSLCLLLVLYFYVLRSVTSFFFFFSSRRRHTRYIGDWSSDVCSSDLPDFLGDAEQVGLGVFGRALVLALGAGDAGRAVRDVAALADDAADRDHQCLRSEERRVGKECGGGWARGD